MCVCVGGGGAGSVGGGGRDGVKAPLRRVYSILLNQARTFVQCTVLIQCCPLPFLCFCPFLFGVSVDLCNYLM